MQSQEKSMNQEWFEMEDIRRRKLKSTVWIPLSASRKLICEGQYGFLGYKEEYFAVRSVAIPLTDKEAAHKLEWDDIGMISQHSGYYQDGVYTPVDQIQDIRGGLTGVNLVLNQMGNKDEVSQWHLNQDFTITLGFKREGDCWVCPSEGYIEVARLHKNEDGNPTLLEVRAEHLKDYLCARDMGLYISSYFHRNAIVADASFISWKGGKAKDLSACDHWTGSVIKIHEGGLGIPYGEKIAIVHVSRNDADGSEDIPDISGIPNDKNITSRTTERGFEGRKLYSLMGRLWKKEWIDPAKLSPRIKRDKLPATVFFIVNEEGTRESKDSLVSAGKWLWFRPDVVMALAHGRGGILKWYTKDTGAVRCSPDYDVHFGVNKLGLVTVYAKDVALLPEWQQQIWAGYNSTPEGGVSEELLASQLKGEPVKTQAPEDYLFKGIEVVNQLSQSKLGFLLFREHELIPELIKKVHRFRAVDEAGLYALAKDVARITADSLDVTAIQSIVPPPNKTKWASLKSLENLLASKINPQEARSITTALVGAYELRHADAHLPGSNIDAAFSLIGIDHKLPTIVQAYQLLSSCVTSIWEIAKVLRRWNN